MGEGKHDERVVELATRCGSDAMHFLVLESGMRHWHDVPPEGTDAYVAYFETERAWVAACSPLVSERADRLEHQAIAAARFVEAARANGRRASFFGTESLEGKGLARLLLGLQPLYAPARWLAALPQKRSLREQLRRARAKGLRVRSVLPHELDRGTPLRAAVERLGAEWLASRHLEPLGFLVTLEPFVLPAAHRYFVAELAGRPVGFLSAVPIGACDAWLVEDMLRSADAPNGTTESLFVALLSAVQDSNYVTLGLTPLAGPIVWPLRAIRWMTRPLFDFEGLRAFRERLQPDTWQPIWLVYPEGEMATRPLIDGLRAFAGGSLAGFAMRSFVRHPSGLPWLLAVPLAPWVGVLGWLVFTRHAPLTGFSRGELALWVVFDMLLLLVLARTAMRPTRVRLVLATSLAATDAALSVGHLAWSGFGTSFGATLLRILAAAAPLAGTTMLAWATTRTARAPADAR